LVLGGPSADEVEPSLVVGASPVGDEEPLVALEPAASAVAPAVSVTFEIPDFTALMPAVATMTGAATAPAAAPAPDAPPPAPAAPEALAPLPAEEPPEAPDVGIVAGDADCDPPPPPPPESPPPGTGPPANLATLPPRFLAVDAAYMPVIAPRPHPPAIPAPITAPSTVGMSL
jgi:hypothetical protein